MQHLMTCESVSVKYDSGIAVREVSFELHPGDYLCIVGENGSGKTSLMKAIVGLVPYAGGKIKFEDLAQKDIGYLPQQTNVQKDFPASVTEVVLSGCLSRHGFRPFYTKEDKRLAEENLARMEIAHLKKHSYRDLSGGQQQRILLARALCATKKLLLLDEPVTGLDPLMAAEMYALLEKLNREGLTIIMVSHDIKSAVKYGNKILHLKTDPLFFGEAADYTASPIGKQMMGGDANAIPAS